MEKRTRRAFISSLFSLAVCGMGSALSSLYAGFRERGALKPSLEKGMAKVDQRFKPAYLELHKNGELRKRGEELWNVMKSCRLCPRECGANRLKGEEGFCQASSQLEISAYHSHFGEEKSLVGKGGSGGAQEN